MPPSATDNFTSCNKRNRNDLARAVTLIHQCPQGVCESQLSGLLWEDLSISKNAKQIKTLRILPLLDDILDKIPQHTFGKNTNSHLRDIKTKYSVFVSMTQPSKELFPERIFLDPNLKITSDILSDISILLLPPVLPEDEDFSEEYIEQMESYMEKYTELLWNREELFEPKEWSRMVRDLGFFFQGRQSKKSFRYRISKQKIYATFCKHHPEFWSKATDKTFRAYLNNWLVGTICDHYPSSNLNFDKFVKAALSNAPLDPPFEGRSILDLDSVAEQNLENFLKSIGVTSQSVLYHYTKKRLRKKT